MTTLVEADTAVGDPASVTLAAAPQEGDLIIGWQMQRSGTSEASFTAPAGFAGTGVAIDVLLADGTYRRSVKLWYKVAGASEGTSYSFDDGTANTKRVIVAVFRPGAGESFGSVLGTAENDDGATTTTAAQDTPIATGTAASLGAGSKFVVGAVGWKMGSVGNTLTFTNWTSISLTEAQHVDGGNNGLSMNVGYADSTATGTFASTANYDLGNGEILGMAAGIAVFDVTTAGATGRARLIGGKLVGGILVGA